MPASYSQNVSDRTPREIELLSSLGIDFILKDFVAELDPLRATSALLPTPLEQGLRTYLP